MVFGLPFPSAGEKVSVYEFNPRPYDVALALLETALSSKTNAPPTSKEVRLAPEVLHRIEQGWELDWKSLPSLYISTHEDLFRLLAVSPGPTIATFRP